MKYSDIKQSIIKTLECPVLDAESVIKACDTLSGKIRNGDYHDRLVQSGLDQTISHSMLSDAALVLNGNSLRSKMKQELGNDYNNPRRFPLGVLLHISAGNMEGLPAYSVVEGLLTGNINLLKLPTSDSGISSFLLRELIQIEPSLQDYIYVFRISSEETTRIQALAKLANAIVVWGGDEAVSSIRAMASPSTKLIEWGHKISFAYITREGAQDAAEKNTSDSGKTAQNTVRIYNRQLESMLSENPWIIPLPRQKLVPTLREYKGYLQTVGLLCSESEREWLSYLLFRSGAVRIRMGSDMSKLFKGEAHDGEYPLRRYSKIIER